VPGLRAALPGWLALCNAVYVMALALVGVAVAITFFAARLARTEARQ
jgi:hypothetical protein